MEMLEPSHRLNKLILLVPTHTPPRASIISGRAFIVAKPAMRADHAPFAVKGDLRPTYRYQSINRKSTF